MCAGFQEFQHQLKNQVLSRAYNNTTLSNTNASINSSANSIPYTYTHINTNAYPSAKTVEVSIGYLFSKLNVWYVVQT
jgi:hypothetical protein